MKKVRFCGRADCPMNDPDYNCENFNVWIICRRYYASLQLKGENNQ